MNIFKNKSFDTIISKNTEFSSVDGSFSVVITAGERFVVEGKILGARLINSSSTENSKLTSKTTLAVRGGTVIADKIHVDNVEIDGNVTVKELRVEGILSLNHSARLTADVIYYRTLSIQNGAVIMANMKHLDFVSEGEII